MMTDCALRLYSTTLAYLDGLRQTADSAAWDGSGMDRDSALDEAALRLSGFEPPEIEAGRPCGLRYRYGPDGNECFEWDGDIRPCGADRVVPVEEVKRAYMWHHPDGRATTSPPSFSRDWVAATRLLELPSGERLSLYAEESSGKWWAGILKANAGGDYWWSLGPVIDDAGPRAITRAFILAVGGESVVE